ncbi:MAG TPA: PQQ-binding-like beta-propeller repeat protein [Dehalococcoidia bacterium]|nr:PQQ-binding-like beta-propeller repeat protein [Dehalococcoidia bacterium]
MKQPLMLGLLVLFGLLLVGCGASVGARGFAGPVENGNTLIVSTGGGRLDGLDSQGRQIWRFPNLWNIPDGSADDLDAIYGTPVVADNGRVVFVGDYNGYLYAFRPADFVEGQTIESPPAASFKLGGKVLGGLLLDSGRDTLYVTSENRIYAIRATSMIQRIENRDAVVESRLLFEADDEIWSTPVLEDGKLLFSSLDGNLYAVDPASGAEIWRFSAGKGLASTPVVSGDNVLVAGFGSTMYAVDLDEGTEAWQFTTSHWIWSASVPESGASSGQVVFGDFDGNLIAVDADSGSEAWSVNIGRGPIRPAPAVSRNTIVVSTDNGWLVGIDASTRETVWERHLGTAMNADMTVQGDEVLISPKGCVTPEGGGDRVYYISVNAANGELSAASGVC